ncbi:hypothetical protein [Vibrio zhanjiangensis]|uniref:hypothetical protein n=1 Tax=Vibrio zhanjiangensis TaxID=1046128 RepID=UPI0024E14D16|nr:hypothetical protein [Vibrio zhanjiangensis]
MLRRTRFNRTMLTISALCWALVALMPVINAHGPNAGVWASLCTLNGFKLVQIDEGKPAAQHAKACPFGHFSCFHHDALPIPHRLLRIEYVSNDWYVYVALNTRYLSAFPRAPPVSLV